MNEKEIDLLLSRLQSEIVKTQKGHEQIESLYRLKEIAKVYRGEDEIISFKKIAENIKLQKDELKMMSGWKGLDDLLKGFRPQQLVVVSALTKSGKTSFLMDLTIRLKAFNPMWLPFEESAEELVRKFLERGEDPPLAYTPAVIKNTTNEWMESRIIEAIAKHGTQMVVVDQLDFIVPFGADNHALRIGQAVRDLRTLAKKWNVVIFLVCHLAKAKMDAEPTLEDLKGSSSIAQEADTVILLWREAKREGGHMVITNNVNVSVQANRRMGKTGNVKMIYDNGHFFEQQWKSNAEHDEEIEKSW